MLKIHSTDAKQAGHIHILESETAEFVWEWFFCVSCAHACQALTTLG